MELSLRDGGVTKTECGIIVFQVNMSQAKILVPIIIGLENPTTFWPELIFFF